MTVTGDGEAPEKCVWHLVRATARWNMRWTWCMLSFRDEDVAIAFRHDDSPTNCVACVAQHAAATRETFMG